jgi:L-ribulose-5-phosphate 3-epimerase
VKSAQLGSSTVPYHKFSLERALAGIANAGLKRVELGAAVGFCDHAAPERLGPGAANELFAQLDRFGLSAVSLNGHADLSTDAGMAAFEKRLQLASDLGVSFVSCGPPEIGAGAPADTEASFYRNMVKTAERAARSGITIVLETWSDLTGSGELCAGVVRKINKPNVRVNYDTANVIYFRGVKPEDDLVAALPYVSYLHVKDKESLKTGTWDCPAIGDGIIDWERVIGKLDEVDYGGPFMLEVELDGNVTIPETLDDALAKSVSFLSKFLS